MKIKLVQGDITKQETTAIVNAANSSLLGGGGVDGAIHRAGGPGILEACRAIRNRQGGCAVGEAVITTGGRLKARYVIHTVGPVWNHGRSHEAHKLEQCYVNSLRLAEDHQCKTIAFPNISTGIYRFPKEQAAKIAVRAVRDFKSTIIEEATFVCYDPENYALYQQELSGTP